MRNLSRQKIAILTDSDEFDYQIAELRNKNISIHKLSLKLESLETYKLVFIDLSYSFDMGFAVIDSINSNPLLSQISIIVLVSKKEDMEKMTFLQNTRISDYISKKIEIKVLLGIMKDVLHIDQQPKKNFSISVKVKMKGNITHISESGALFSSNAFFSKTTTVVVEMAMLEKILNIDKPIFNISKSNVGLTGRFITELDFFNLSEKNRKDIRKLIIGWSLK